jgi:hypothetical protein
VTSQHQFFFCLSAVSLSEQALVVFLLNFSICGLFTHFLIKVTEFRFGTSELIDLLFFFHSTRLTPEH